METTEVDVKRQVTGESAQVVAVLFGRFGPYHCARLRAAASQMSVVGIEVVRKDSVYQWDVIEDPAGFNRLRLFQETGCFRPPVSELRKRLHSALDKLQPRIVALPGWSGPHSLLGLLWCLAADRPAIVMTESTAHDDRKDNAVRLVVKRRLMRLYSAALAGGSRQTAYLKELGFSGPVFEGYDVVDNAHFAQGSPGEEAGAVQRPYFLVCARFVAAKNLPGLLEAYCRYRHSAGGAAWALKIAGDGPQMPFVRQLVERFNLISSVELLGFVQYDGLPRLYNHASAFVLPSLSEPWGLVVNEAMAAGLPVIVSNRCGCAPDLVEEGGNGFTFDPYDTDGLAELMLTVSTMPEQQRQAMGRRSREIIQNWGLERFAQGLKSAVEVALSSQTPKASVFDRLLLRVLAYREIHD